MAERALYLLTDDARLQAFRRNALARAKEFDIEHILPKYEAYYEKVLARFRARQHED
jgi:glycosyltransferase involved in cell wall biosynthesis